MKFPEKLLLLFFVSIYSCSSPTSIKIPEQVKDVLEKAGHNRVELEKVIDHYGRKEADSLKLKAAFFLIKNLEDSYYYEGEVLDEYHQYSRLVWQNSDKGVYIHGEMNFLMVPFIKTMTLSMLYRS